ncbi:MAG: metallophosphoesterase [bacterium]
MSFGGSWRRGLWQGLSVAALVVCVAASASAQTLTRGPYIQNPLALPSAATFVWWTNVAGDSTVEYGLTPALGSSLTVAQAGSCDVGSAGTCHSVTLTGLLTGTLYYYRLKTNGTAVQATTYFNTQKSPTDAGDLFFTVIGDWGQGTSNEATIANLQNTANPPMIITVGDNAYTNGTQSELDNNAMAYYQVPLQRAFYFPTLGNHDLNTSGVSGWANSAHIKTFVLPTNSPEPERYYSFEDGDALFISMDSDGCCSSQQTAWLENLLSTTQRRWKFVFYHHTAYSCANGVASIGSDAGVRSNWAPIWEKYGVDIVFHGHDHIYERTKFMDDYLANGSPGSDGLGTVYVMTGGGGATLDDAAKIDGSNLPYRQPFFFSPKESCYWLAHDCPLGASSYCSFKRSQYTSVVISGNTLTMQAIDSNGQVFDTYSVTKAAPVPTETPTPTPLPPTATATVTATPPPTPSSSATATATQTDTATPADTLTPTTVATATVTATLTATATPSATATATNTPVSTATRTATATSTRTFTGTATRTATPTVTATFTATASVTPTVPTPTSTPTPRCGSGLLITEARLDVARNLFPTGDEKLKIRGAMQLTQLSPIIDPASHGFTLTVLDSSGNLLFERYVPAGLVPSPGQPGWRLGHNSWTYKDKAGTIAAGIRKVTVKQRVPGQLTFKVTGKDGLFAVPPSSPFLTLIITPGDSSTAANNQCATRTFNPPSGAAPKCDLLAGGKRVRCR